jgi:hypothetical protein
VAADLRAQFLVDSGRYPSILDVMRDGYGIKGRRKATTTFVSLFGRSARNFLGPLLMARRVSSGGA